MYDYQCEKCAHVVEVTHGVHDKGPTRCEVCGGPMRKLMSSPSIHFKGSGWAKKDAHADRSSGASKSATKSGADHESAASEAKADKPAAEASESASAQSAAAKSTPDGSSSD
jgi:putative FmdB family regulatory protein